MSNFLALLGFGWGTDCVCEIKAKQNLQKWQNNDNFSGWSSKRGKKDEKVTSLGLEETSKSAPGWCQLSDADHLANDLLLANRCTAHFPQIRLHFFDPSHLNQFQQRLSAQSIVDPVRPVNCREKSLTLSLSAAVTVKLLAWANAN